MGGVIGVKHPRYRLFGDIVNTAARMEARSDPGRLHVAENAANILRETGMFKLTDRGRAVQADPIRPTVKAPETKRSKQ